jgi:hypothetical protein
MGFIEEIKEKKSYNTRGEILMPMAMQATLQPLVQADGAELP